MLSAEARYLGEDDDWEAIATWCGGRPENHEEPGTGEQYTVLHVGDQQARQGDIVVRCPDGRFRVYSRDAGLMQVIEDAVFYEHGGDRVFAYVSPRSVLGEDPYLTNLVPELACAILEQWPHLAGWSP